MNTKDDLATLTAEYERLRKIRHELHVQYVTVDQRLAEIEVRLRDHEVPKNAKAE